MLTANDAEPDPTKKSVGSPGAALAKGAIAVILPTAAAARSAKAPTSST